MKKMCTKFKMDRSSSFQMAENTDFEKVVLKKAHLKFMKQRSEEKNVFLNLTQNYQFQLHTAHVLQHCRCLQPVFFFSSLRFILASLLCCTAWNLALSMRLLSVDDAYS